MRTFDKLHSVTKLQLMGLGAAVLCIASAMVLLLDPSARKGPLGFGPPAPMITFHMRDNSFTISYPANWIAGETPQGSHGDPEVVAVILVSGKYQANVIVATKALPAGGLDDVKAWGESRSALHANYRSLTLKPLTGDRGTGFINEYTWTSPGLSGEVWSHCEDTYILYNATAYAISYCSKEQDWQGLESVYAVVQQSLSFGTKR